MRVLIDGHNALGALAVRGRTHEEKRLALLARVVAATEYATVFFDARNAPAGMPERRREHGVDVVYCRRREADQAIIDAVRRAHAPDALVVVTNDREVAGRCAQLGARAMAVRAFFGPPAARDDGPAPRPRRMRRIRFLPSDFGLPPEVDLADPRGIDDDDPDG